MTTKFEVIFGVLLILTVSAWALTAHAQETGECLTSDEANARLKESGDVVVAQGQIVDERGVGIFFRLILQRPDGTFYEGSLDQNGMVCHVQDFVGDPRVKGATL